MGLTRLFVIEAARHISDITSFSDSDVIFYTSRGVNYPAQPQKCCILSAVFSKKRHWCPPPQNKTKQQQQQQQQSTFVPKVFTHFSLETYCFSLFKPKMKQLSILLNISLFIFSFVLKLNLFYLNIHSSKNLPNVGSSKHGRIAAHVSLQGVTVCSKCPIYSTFN